MRIDGRLRRLQAPDLTPADTEHMVQQVLRGDLIEEFRKTNEADFAYSLPGLGRFRVNAFRQRGSAGLVFRDGRLLITQRHRDAHLGGLWEFPGGKREPGETFVQWDPYNVPILTDKSGKIEFRDMIAGVTMKRDVDEATPSWC